MPSSFDPKKLPTNRYAEFGIKDISLNRVFQGWSSYDVLTIRQDYRGREIIIEREVHDHGHGVGVLCYDPIRRVTWLVRQLRWGSLISEGEPRPLEVPAGLIDKEGGPEETAHREAWEEIGFRLKSLQFVAAPYSSPGAVTERIHLYLGEIDPEAAAHDGGGLEEEHEDIEVVEVSFDALFRLNDEGLIFDMKTMILAEALRRKIMA